MSFTVHHPRIEGVKVEGLSAAERDAHKKAGWVSSEPDDRPPGNASRDDWVAYAVTQGADADEVADLTRDELRETYGD